MDKTTHTLIKYRKKEVRKRMIRLPNFKWSIGIFVVFLLLLLLSWVVYKNNNWLSGVLVSTSCGCVTGLIFYFLANLRNNQGIKLQYEYDSIKNVYDIISKIMGYEFYYRYYWPSWGEKRNIHNDCYEILTLLDELETARGKIPYSVYNTVESLGYDPIDRDNLNTYRSWLNADENDELLKKRIKEISDSLIPVATELHGPLYTRKDQLMFLGRYFF